MSGTIKTACVAAGVTLALMYLVNKAAAGNPAGFIAKNLA